MTIDRPPLFNGTTSGVAWWRDFAIWLAGTGAIDSFPRVKMAFAASMLGPAKDFYKTLTAEQLKDVDTLQKAFEDKYPGTETADTLFEALFDDPTESFRQWLRSGISDADMLTEVEVETRGLRNEVVKKTMLYFHWWVQQAYLIGSQVPATDMSEAVKGRELYDALPVALQMFINTPKGSLKEVAHAVSLCNRHGLAMLTNLSQRMAVVEKRVPPRSQGGNQPTSQTPFVYQPTNINAGGGSGSPPANGAMAVRGNKHLCFPNNPDGQAAYQRAFAAWSKSNPDTSAVSPYKPMPLTPGTQPPGPGVCDNCGQRGHIRPACDKGNVLPPLEVKYRGINSYHQRTEDKANGTPIRAVDAVEEFDPELFYYQEGNGVGRA